MRSVPRQGPRVPARGADPSPTQAQRTPGREEAALRIFFHLRRAHELFPDEQGVEVSGPEEARAHALTVIDELSQDESHSWSGWSLVAADHAGDVLFTVDLEGLV